MYDRRGHGRSSPFSADPRGKGYLEAEPAVLLALLDALGIEHALLFGHSDGGTIALLAAGDVPARISAIITEGAHVFVEEKTLDGVGAARAALATTDLRDRIARHHGEKTDAVASAWIDTWLSPAYRDWNIERAMPRVRCPALIMQGIDDEYGTFEQVRAIIAGIGAGARGLMLPACAHSPHREARETVLDACAEFIATIVGER